MLRTPEVTSGLVGRAASGVRASIGRMGSRYRFTSTLWEWEARDNWFFVSLSEEASDEISQLPFPPRGFGSIPVRATIGHSTWTTSIFPGGDGVYILPVRKAVRAKEKIDKDDEVNGEVELME